MNKGVTRTLLALLTALSMGAVAPARAVDVKAGNWDVSLTGNVNAFATYTVCGSPNVQSSVGADQGLGLACTRLRDASPNNFSIESGLLPSAFVFTAKTRAYNLDVSATIGLYPGLHVSDTRTGNTHGGIKGGQFTMDVRQNFLTFGDASWGTIKLGKDLGLFGADAILSDMTLLGVGAGTDGRYNNNVTIGHIGTGYLYADWIPQITYISPKFSGAQLSLAAIESFSMGGTATPYPGAQAKLTYDLAGGMGRIWAGGMYQNTKEDTAASVANHSLNSIVGEAGAKVNVQGLGALAYGYYGKGVGTTLIGLAANAGLNKAGDGLEGRKSYGWFLQATYAIPNTKFKPGVSWGRSYLGQVTADDAAVPDTDALLKYNEMYTAALFYAATDSLTLVAEYDHTRSKTWGGASAKTNSGALGAIIFF